MHKEKHISLAVDAVILRKNGKILLEVRNKYPFEGKLVLPGGHVKYGETVEQAVKREVKEETGLDVSIIKLIGVYSDPKRDPRGHTVSVAFLCKEIGGSLKPNEEVKEFEEVSKIPLDMGFDHRKILADAGVIYE